MDFMELAADRLSVRSFSDRPVEQEKIDKILKAVAKAFDLPRISSRYVFCLSGMPRRFLLNKNNTTQSNPCLHKIAEIRIEKVS